MQAEANRVALVAGANGMVGLALLRALLDSGDYSRVIAVTRRPLAFEAPRLVNRILRFEELEAGLKGTSASDAYCCLGTTLRQAGSQQAFSAVDHDLVLRFARAAQLVGVQTFVAVSSVGADPAASSFYLRVKGETEAALEALRFRSLHLLQPGVLLGARAQFRPLEALGRLLLPLLNPLLPGKYARWRAIDVRIVAAAMRAAAASGRLGVLRHTWASMQSLARSGRPAAQL
jgi:uncharacterized protein YbjT (DUF2867 family)